MMKGAKALFVVALEASLTPPYKSAWPSHAWKHVAAKQAWLAMLI